MWDLSRDTVVSCVCPLYHCPMCWFTLYSLSSLSLSLHYSILRLASAPVPVLLSFWFAFVVFLTFLWLWYSWHLTAKCDRYAQPVCILPSSLINWVFTVLLCYLHFTCVGFSWLSYPRDTHCVHLFVSPSPLYACGLRLLLFYMYELILCELPGRENATTNVVNKSSTRVTSSTETFCSPRSAVFCSLMSGYTAQDLVLSLRWTREESLLETRQA